ncbi:MAG: IclR family transcriptional regulator [Candidatus Dormibacteraeota bacterium]|nr:IclR family transcriptional regulator [Candidatus Dormibacteraeota bacterium]
MMQPAAGESVRSVSRALQILAAFDEEHAICSLTELLLRADLPKTTALRLIQTLARNGFLFRRGDGRFCLGPVLIRLSRAVSVAWRLPVAADATMEAVRAQTRETVNLYVLEGLTRVCVAQKQGPQHIRFVIPIGVRLPLWAGASGKLLLAHRDRDFFESVLSAAGREEDFSAGLAVELRQIRAQGYAVSRDERERGASSVAAPISDGRGGVTAALAVSGPTSRFSDDRVAEFAAVLKEAVQQMAAALTGSADGISPAPAVEGAEP